MEYPPGTQRLGVAGSHVPFDPESNSAVLLDQAYNLTAAHLVLFDQETKIAVL